MDTLPSLSRRPLDAKRDAMSSDTPRPEARSPRGFVDRRVPCYRISCVCSRARGSMCKGRVELDRSNGYNRVLAASVH